MSIVRTTESVTIGIASSDFNATDITIPVEIIRLEDIEDELEHEEDFLFGCDYATVVATTDRKKMDELISMITEEDLQTLYDEYEMTGIPVYNINGAYLMSVEAEYLQPETFEKIEREFVVFGAGADDSDIPSCLDGFRFKRDKGLTVDEFREFDDADLEDGDALAYSECGIDFLQRIYEYSESPNQHKEIELVLGKIDAALGTRDPQNRDNYSLTEIK
jgi:hypothetical protein